MTGLVRGVAAAALLIIAVEPLHAQTSDPVSTAARAAGARLARNIVAAFESFPADKFQYKPTPAQMTVADIARHLADDNSFGCSSLGGSKPATEPKLMPTDDVAKIIASMKRSFELCAAAMATLTDAKMADAVPFWGNRNGTRAEMVLEMQEDWADHYSQLANYLRLNGILPPTARPPQR